ncbi:MAG: response regulator, partial [Kangiellaceae bacterium]|nr:response regulator [Kangiellaceae bacterium]
MSNYAELFTGKPVDDTDSTAEESAVNQYKILLVDDEPAVLKSLKRCFRRENYNILTVDNPLDALGIIAKEPIQLVVSDFKMPKMNGADFLREVKKTHPQIIRIMLTGHADTSAVMTAIKEGAVYKFILKPWNDDDLRVTVALALEQYELQVKNQALEEENKKHQKDLSRLNKLTTTNRTQLFFVLNKKNYLTDTQVQQLVKQTINSN